MFAHVCERGAVYDTPQVFGGEASKEALPEATPGLCYLRFGGGNGKALSSSELLREKKLIAQPKVWLRSVRWEHIEECPAGLYAVRPVRSSSALPWASFLAQPNFHQGERCAPFPIVACCMLAHRLMMGEKYWAETTQQASLYEKVLCREHIGSAAIALRWFFEKLSMDTLYAGGTPWILASKRID